MMKRTTYILLALLCTSFTIKAQNLDDAIRFSQTSLTGTARSAAMGNAFGALGGDFSALSINPAGIGVYRSSEFTLTPSVVFNQTNTTYFGTNTEDDRYSFPFNQIGVVGTYKPLREQEKGIISTHFAFGYNRVNNFNENSIIRGSGIESSQLGEFVINSDNKNPDQLNQFREQLAFNTWLLDTVPGTYNYFNAYEVLYGNGDIDWRALNGIDQRRIMEKTGYAGEYSFTGGINISHTLLLGGTLGIQNLHYRESSIYRETNAYGLDPSFVTDLDYYDFTNYLKQSGTGVNFKLGMIFKPLPILRIGAAFHTPTFYDIRESWESSIRAVYQDGEVFEEFSPIGDYKYRFQTPYRLVGSAALVLGKFMLISADYEFIDNQSAKFKHADSFDDSFLKLNEDIDNRFQASHHLRGGVEIKPTAEFALRGGVTYQNSPYKEEYQNDLSHFFTYSGGFGYRAKSYFIDFAYRMTKREYDYFNYNWHPDNDKFHGTPEPARILSTDHQAMLTLGWKF
jgi:hypothetical protein